MIKPRMTVRTKQSAGISSFLKKYIKSPCAVIALALFILNVILINSICMQFSGEDSLQQPVHVVVKRSANTSSQTDRTVGLFFKKRQKALLESTTKKVLILGYLLGGSSYIGDVFNQNPEAMYWFEPMNAFYQAYHGTGIWPKPFDIFVHQNMSIRSIPVMEHRQISRFMQYLLSCDTDHVSPQSLGHKGLQYQLTTRDFYKCILNHDASGVNCSKYLQAQCGGNFDNTILNNCSSNIELAWRRKNVSEIFKQHIKCVRDLKNKQGPCLSLLKPLCKRAKIQSAMVIRMTMDSIPNIINSFPDLHVIHVVRDPRAIVYSRLERNSIWNRSCNDTLVEAEYLCYRMKNDIEKREKFESRFPGVFMTLKYEDHFRNEVNSTTNLYDFIGQDIHPDLSKWLQSNDHNTKRHTLSNTEPLQSMERWRTFFPKPIKEAMTAKCRVVLERLGYTLDV